MLPILNNLNEEQRKTLKQFRLVLDDLLTPEDTDYVLVKFLRAKSFDLNAAVKIFKDNYYNRTTVGVNTLLDTYKRPEVIEKYESSGILGYAKDRTLIRYTACGRMDIYGFIMSMSCYDLRFYYCHLFETDRKFLKDQSLKSGKSTEEITCILDMEGFNFQQVLHKSVIETGLGLLQNFQDCYPEIWSYVLVINVPKFFDKVFNIVKPILRATILERIYIADKGSTKDLLLKYIDENVLPAFLGGKRVDSNGDPECKEFITFGGKIPKAFYGQNTRIPLSPTDPDVKCLNINQRSTGNVSYVNREANAKVRLQVRSENGSISMCILYKELDPFSDNVELPAEYDYLDENADNFTYKQICVEVGMQPHCVQEDVLVTLPWLGLYVFRFNNSSYWFTPRKILVKCSSTFSKSNEVK